MKFLLLLLIPWVSADFYKETQDFQYSRSSGDDVKQGFYKSQKGNMGGNYEDSHNMDRLAQTHMKGLIEQVGGQLGIDPSSIGKGLVPHGLPTGSVYGSATASGKSMSTKSGQTGAGDGFAEGYDRNNEYAGSSQNRYSNTQGGRQHENYGTQTNNQQRYYSKGSSSQQGYSTSFRTSKSGHSIQSGYGNHGSQQGFRESENLNVGEVDNSNTNRDTYGSRGYNYGASKGFSYGSTGQRLDSSMHQERYGSNVREEDNNDNLQGAHLNGDSTDRLSSSNLYANQQNRGETAKGARRIVINVRPGQTVRIPVQYTVTGNRENENKNLHNENTYSESQTSQRHGEESSDNDQYTGTNFRNQYSVPYGSTYSYKKQWVSQNQGSNRDSSAQARNEESAHESGDQLSNRGTGQINEYNKGSRIIPEGYDGNRGYQSSYSYRKQWATNGSTDNIGTLDKNAAENVESSAHTRDQLSSTVSGNRAKTYIGEGTILPTGIQQKGYGAGRRYESSYSYQKEWGTGASTDKSATQNTDINSKLEENSHSRDNLGSSSTDQRFRNYGSSGSIVPKGTQLKGYGSGKQYESSYSYQKEWGTDGSTDDNIHADRKLEGASHTRDSLASGTTNHQGSMTYNGGNRAASTYRYNARDEIEKGETGNTYNSDLYKSIGATPLVGDSDLKNTDSTYVAGKPKSYQSSYSYHKSWEKHGTPYVIREPQSSLTKSASSTYEDSQIPEGQNQESYSHDRSRQNIEKYSGHDQTSQNTQSHQIRSGESGYSQSHSGSLTTDMKALQETLKNQMGKACPDCGSGNTKGFSSSYSYSAQRSYGGGAHNHGDVAVDDCDTHNSHKQKRSTGEQHYRGQQTYLNQQSENLGQQSTNLDQQTGNFEQQTGDFDQQTGNFEQQTGHFDQQIGNFEQQIGHFDQQTGNLEQQTGHFDKKTGNLEQQTGHFDQKTGNLEQQTGHFDQQTGNLEQQTGHFDQQTGNLEQQTGHFDQKTGNLEQQTGDFDQKTGNLEQKTGHFDQQTGNLEQQIGHFDQQTGNLEQQTGHFDQKTGNLEQQTGHFDQQTGNLEQQTSSFDQQAGHIEQQTGYFDQKIGTFDQQTSNQQSRNSNYPSLNKQEHQAINIGNVRSQYNEYKPKDIDNSQVVNNEDVESHLHDLLSNLGEHRRNIDTGRSVNKPRTPQGRTTQLQDTESVHLNGQRQPINQFNNQAVTTNKPKNSSPIDDDDFQVNQMSQNTFDMDQMSQNTFDMDQMQSNTGFLQQSSNLEHDSDFLQQSSKKETFDGFENLQKHSNGQSSNQLHTNQNNILGQAEHIEIETTTEKGFWDKVGDSAGNAKDKVKSWFG